MTAATAVTSGLAIVIALEDEPGRRRYAVTGLCALMALGFVLVCALPPGRHFFALASPTTGMAAAWATGSTIAVALLAIAPLSFRSRPLSPPTVTIPVPASCFQPFGSEVRRATSRATSFAA